MARASQFSVSLKSRIRSKASELVNRYYERRQLSKERYVTRRVRELQDSHNLAGDHYEMELRYLGHIVEKDVILFERPTFQATARKLEERLTEDEAYGEVEDPTVQWSKLVWESYRKRDTRSIAPPNTCSDDEAKSSDSLDVIRRRRSVRLFSDVEPELDDLIWLIEESSWAPSSCNRQPVVCVICRQPDTKAMLEDALPGGKGFLRRAPYVLILCADVRSYRIPFERWLPYVDIGAYAQTLLLLAEYRCLQTCIVSWKMSNRVEEAVKAKIGIEWYLMPVLAVCLGKGSYDARPAPRKQVDKMYSHEKA